MKTLFKNQTTENSLKIKTWNSSLPSPILTPKVTTVNSLTCILYMYVYVYLYKTKCTWKLSFHNINLDCFL